MSKALLVLSDGVVFEGEGFGSEGETLGEVVFNTSMTGYQEILTDASYKGQIVTMTYPQIGNYGINEEDIESQGGIKAEGFIVKEVCEFPSNWRSQTSLVEYMKKSNTVGIQGIDTRALTRHLRTHGAQMGIISTKDLKPDSLLKKVRKHPGISVFDLVKDVTTKEQYKWNEGVWKWHTPSLTLPPRGGGMGGGDNSEPRTPNSNPPLPPFSKGGRGGIMVVVYDFGIKFNILRNLVEAGFDVTVVPAQTPAEKVLE
ncbi:MAG: carbamoyl phosphate synthase small subunit, partial [Nitrospirota bacterium]|nr:carbamoyl phosphate synthase small subunit [Nitrospirota bacterium]